MNYLNVSLIGSSTKNDRCQDVTDAMVTVSLIKNPNRFFISHVSFGTRTANYL